MSIIDHRLAAKAHIVALADLITAQRPEGELASLVDECQSLARAIEAFHMEGIRFRMFNVDRLLGRADLTLPEVARELFTKARAELEAAGFHTRSHQAPG
jgi:hypothetical protein